MNAQLSYNHRLTRALISLTLAVFTMSFGTLASGQTLDTGYHGPSTGDPPCAHVSTLLPGTNGKVFVGGTKTYMYNNESACSKGYVCGGWFQCVDAGDGALASHTVYALAVQSDGKIVVGGAFNTLRNEPRLCIGRLNADGTLDYGFNPGMQGGPTAFILQADGKIIVGGQFFALGGQPRNNLGRLNQDGTLDGGFNPGAGDSVHSFAVQADGKILVGGRFSTLGGQPRGRLGRLNVDGTLDNGFNPGVSDVPYKYNVNCLAVQADGKILVGGAFTNLVGKARLSLGRLNSDGTLDSGFNPGANGEVICLAVQTDGKILVGGSFTMLGGEPRNRIGRLNPDGSPDPWFDPNADGTVETLALQPDGKVLVGGWFGTLDGRSCYYYGRLINTEPATQSFTCDGATLTWLRGGTSPEVWRTSFDASTNGVNWFSLGEGLRIAGGWQVSGLSLPAHATVRARGYATGGRYNGSAWFVESVVVPEELPPRILVNDDELGMHSGKFGFRVSGTRGQVVVVEGSRDFATWIPLQTNMLGDAPALFTDTSTNNNPARFYRARLSQ